MAATFGTWSRFRTTSCEIMSRPIPHFRDKAGRKQYWDEVDGHTSTSVSEADGFTTFAIIVFAAIVITLGIYMVMHIVSPLPEPELWLYEEGLNITYDNDLEQFVVVFNNPQNDTRVMSVTVALMESGKYRDAYPIFVKEVDTFPAHVAYHPYNVNTVHGIIVDIEKNTGELYRYTETFTCDGTLTIQPAETRASPI